MRRAALAAFVAFALLPACGGGGGSPTLQPTAIPSASIVPTKVPSAAPTATPTPRIAPSATPTPTPTPTASAVAQNGSYLPFASGDVWTFDDGSTVKDVGPTPIAGTSNAGLSPVNAEQFDFYDAGGTFVGNVQMLKGPWPQGLFATVPSQDPLTNVAAVTNAIGEVNYFGANQVIYYGQNDLSAYDFPGMPIADDTPVRGEEFFLSSNSEEFVAQAIVAPGCCVAPFPAEPQPLPSASNTNDSVVVNTGGSQGYPYTAPVTTIGNIATTLFDPSEGDAANFGFAAGYGFTSIYTGSATIHLESFTGPGATGAAATRARLLRRPALTLRRRDGAVSLRDVLGRM